MESGVLGWDYPWLCQAKIQISSTISLSNSVTFLLLVVKCFLISFSCLAHCLSSYHLYEEAASSPVSSFCRHQEAVVRVSLSLVFLRLHRPLSFSLSSCGKFSPVGSWLGPLQLPSDPLSWKGQMLDVFLQSSPWKYLRRQMSVILWKPSG